MASLTEHLKNEGYRWCPDHGLFENIDEGTSITIDSSLERHRADDKDLAFKLFLNSAYGKYPRLGRIHASLSRIEEALSDRIDRLPLVQWRTVWPLGSTEPNQQVMVEVVPFDKGIELFIRVNGYDIVWHHFLYYRD